MIPHAATIVGLIPLRGPWPPFTPAQIRKMLGHHLGQVNRWAGASETPISVAQHSVLAFDVFRELFPARRPQAIYALLHDAHEAVINDLYGPLEALIDAERPGFRPWLRGLKGDLDARIRDALRVPEPRRPDGDVDTDLLAAVHDADLVTADLEWKHRIPVDNGRSPFADHAARFKRIDKPRLRPLSVPAAAELFESTLAAELAARRWEE